MNLVIISGTMGPIKEENVYTRGDGVTVIDGCIKKIYTYENRTKETVFFFTASGNKADTILANIREGDKVIVSGKLISKVDSDGRWWFTINVTNMSRMVDEDGDI